MKSVKSYQQSINKVLRCWKNGEYKDALRLVDGLLAEWPGNARLHVLWANLVQLQDETEYTLTEAKQALIRATALDDDSPAGHLELGHFLNAVQDNPGEAAAAFSRAAEVARRQLIDALLGQAGALVELRSRDAAWKCLEEAIRLLNASSPGDEQDTEDGETDFAIRDTSGRIIEVRLQGPFSDRVRDLLHELCSHARPKQILRCRPSE